MSSVQRSLIEVAESLAKKMGYGSADEAEASLGTHAFTRKVKEEAAADVAPKSTELPRAFEAMGRTEANAARDKAAAVERRGLQNRIEGNINRSIDVRDVSKYNETTPHAASDKHVVRPEETDFSIPPIDATPDINKKLATGGLAATVAGSAAMYSGRNADKSFADNERMQQTEPAANKTEGPVATAPDKGVSGGVRNLSEKSVAVKPGNRSGQSTKNIPSTIDNLEEKVRIFNQQGFETGDFKEQLTEARRVYEEDRDRNRALGLAQMVAQSIARMGAAVEGNKRGRYIGDINSPSVDYEARTKEARDDYRDQVSDISARQKEAVGETKYKHEQEISAVKLRIEDEWNKRRSQQDAADKAIASKKDDARFVFNTALTQYNDIDKDQEDLKKQNKAISNLVGAIQATDPKEKAKEATYAAEAGLSALELDKLKAEAPKQSKFFGLTEGEDPKQQATYIQETLGTRFRQRLGELEDKKQEYIQQMRGTGLMPQQAAPQPVQTSGQPTQSPVVSVRGPSGQIAQMRQDVFDAKYSGKPGYEIVK